MKKPDAPDKMGCNEFQALVSELFNSGEDIDRHPHLQRCALCRALVADLKTIAEEANKLLS